MSNAIITEMSGRWRLLYRIALTLSVAYYAALVLLPGWPVRPLLVATDTLVYLVPLPHLFWMLAAMGPLLSGLTWLAHRKIAPGLWAPLGALPLTLIGYLAPHRLPADVPGNLLFWGTLVILALLADRLYTRFVPGPAWRARPQRVGLALLLGLTLFYTGAGVYFSTLLGEHYVDEGHYLVQAESLYQDRDLNIRNNFGFDVDADIERRMGLIGFDETSYDAVRAEATHQVRRHLHISFRSPPDRWYSWHPYGLSILLAPTMGSESLLPRQGLLGLIAAVGIWLTFLICIEAGRSIRASLLVCLGWAFSTFYVVYAIRALPETLGATLFAGAVYSYMIARRAPLRSFALLMVCCAYMPLAHPRFLACAGLAGLFFYLRAFSGQRPPRRVLIFYLSMLAVAVAGTLGYLLLNHAAYASITAYPLDNVFGMYPEGRWLLLFSERGLLFAFPATVLLILGNVFACLHDRDQRSLHLMGLIGFVGMTLTMGAVECWDGGPTMYGRYLLVCLPALVPGAVLLLERTSRIGRYWAGLLLAFSAAFTVIGLFSLTQIGRPFLHVPWQAIRESLPLLRHLFFPYHVSDIMIGWPYHGWEAFTVNPFPFLLLLGTLAIVWPLAPRWGKVRIGMPCLALALLLVSSALLHARHGRPHTPLSPVALERHLSGTWVEWADVRGGDLDPADLTAQANRFAFWPSLRLTTEDLGQLAIGRHFSQPHVEENDWAARGYRWLTLAPPSAPGLPGPRIVRIRGTASGDITVHWAIRQGRHTLLEETIPVTAPDGAFDIEHQLHLPSLRGHIYLLMRCEGDGEVAVHELDWKPAVGISPPGAALPSLLRQMPDWIK
jgi:hypothetical protein